MTEKPAARTPPPSKHQLALMIWLCVFPTLTVISLAFGDWLRTLSPVLRTFVLATIAVRRRPPQMAFPSSTMAPAPTLLLAADRSQVGLGREDAGAGEWPASRSTAAAS